MSAKNKFRYTAAPPDYRYIIVRFPIILIASLFGATAVNLFLRPAQLAPGGITGTAVLLNEFFPTVPLGLVIFIGNIILLALGYRQLGGWNTVIITMIFATLFSINIELLEPFIPADGISDDRLLNALYTGVVGGLAGGMVYRIGGTLGGSSVISRILNTRFGVPTSTAYLYVDSFVILAAGLIFDWEASLFSLIVLVVDGFVADYILEGPSLIRIVTVITNKPAEISSAIMMQMSRGVTSWEGEGRYTNERRDILFITVTRSQVNQLKSIVNEHDPYAFVVVGDGHVAYGGGFKGKGRGGRLPHMLPQLPRRKQHSQDVPSASSENVLT